MSKKTSTAALESFCKRQFTNRRRAPRHPAGARLSAKKQRSDEKAREFGQAQIVVQGEDAMKGKAVSGAAGKLRVILPVILRITFSLALWTLGLTTMAIAGAKNAPMDSTKQQRQQPSTDQPDGLDHAVRRTFWPTKILAS